MNAAARPPAEPRRAEARRAQILGAAAACFRSSGFHGASIAAISAAAGMSAGHIYHYFDNKEAIIAGIVAKDLDHVLDMSAQLRSSPDVLRAVIEAVPEGVHRAVDADAAGLKLEIAAEASRDEQIAGIVRAADAQGMASLVATLRCLRHSRGHQDDDLAIAGMAEIIAALFDGLMVRSIRNPGLDREAAIRLVQRLIGFIADDTADAVV
jgi:AcrR family transcriptional regulator